ncbi:MAG: ferredoxin--NADP+ reductase [Myxococcota bacterium]|jgi:ferredoxin--NADP+ reductase
MKHPSRTVQIDLFDRLPVPFGLVRAGVAPDHPNIKAVTRAYARTASKPGFRFFGNVELGTDLSLEDLDAHYDQWLLSVGCADDRKLGIPGEDLVGCHSAREFVAWYNGHPDYANATFDLSKPGVGIIGVGNVALDVARILMTSPDDLAKTDIADHALQALRESKVQHVTLFARRGPAAAACTPKELGELGAIPGVDVLIDTDSLTRDTHTMPEEPHPNLLANLAILADFAQREHTPGNRTIRIEFFASPTQIQGDERVSAIEVGQTELEARGDGWSARLTDVREVFPVDQLFRSIGYRGHVINGVPFDTARGRLPNTGGRILTNASGPLMPKGYTAGWAKRGPSGVIGTNRSCAQATVDLMVQDTPEPCDLPASDAIEALLAERGVRVVSWQDWQALDAHEIQTGQAVGKPREKLVSVAQALALLDH